MANSYQQNINAGGWNRPQTSYQPSPAAPQQSEWNNPQNVPFRQYSNLSYIERNTAELAKNNSVVANLANATMAKSNEIMEEIKKAGLITQSIKDGKTYTNKMMVKVEPAIKYDTRQPILHADGSPVYKATIKLSVNNSTLQLTAQETSSHETQIAYMGAFADRQYFKQNEIQNSPCDNNIKAIANIIKDKFLVENQKSYQQTYQKQYTQNSAPQQSIPQRQQTQQWQTASKPMPQQQSAWHKQQSPTPSNQSSLEILRRKINAYFTVHSEAVLNKNNELVNNAYAQLKKDKFGNDRIYILNHTDTIVIEMGLEQNNSPYVRALDWTLTKDGLPRLPNDTAPPASIMLNNEIDVHDYVNLSEVKSVIGNFLNIEIHFPKTLEESVALSNGDYEWIKERIEADNNTEGKKESSNLTPNR